MIIKMYSRHNLLDILQTEPETSDDFTEYLTSQYDAVKRGYDTLNLVPIQTGNISTMESHSIKSPFLKKIIQYKVEF